MSRCADHDGDERGTEGLSGSEDDGALDEDMEALRRACMLTGTNPSDLDNEKNPSADSDSDDDLELVRSIRNRFSMSSSACEALSLKPLASLPPAASDEEDDFETLLAIQRRFSALASDSFKHEVGVTLKKPEQVHASSLSLEKETTNTLFVNRTNSCEGFTDSEDFSNTRSYADNMAIQPSGPVESHQKDACKLSMPLKKSCFPKAALLLIDGIKKNRASQKFLRNKLIQLEARIEENKKLKERVKILKDFQVSCRKRTGRALSQKKDPRVQLISAKKMLASKDSKANDRRVSTLCYGPAENYHVAKYRMTITNSPLSLERKKWSKVERQNLEKGIKQQFQEMVLKISVDQFSGAEGSSGDSNDFDKILASIKDLEVTPEKIREFLPKVNWEQLASMYLVGRSSAECQARWLNFEDPLINHNPWTANEDKHLLLLVQEKGINNWFDIAVSLGSNRTPFQCLARYQRSLNASILKSEWTKDDDAQLRAAVEVFGENDWQSVASALEGRTGAQCSNRWKKSLHPTRERVGKWVADEDKRLKVAVMLFGAKNWNKIAQFVHGRTQAQCRERWVNSLDPSLNWGEWTEEEDSRLKAAIVEYGYCWAKVAACVPPRTDNQCRRRWKKLLPHEVPLLQEARRIQKAALVSNFVDRESERPALGPTDFLPLPLTTVVSEPENSNPCSKQKGRLRGRASSRNKKNAASCVVLRKIRSKECEQQFQASSGTIEEKKRPKAHSRKKKCIKPVADNLSVPLPPESLESGTTSGVCIEAAADSTSPHMWRNQNSTFSSGKSMLSVITNDTEGPLDHMSCPHSTLLTPTNDEVVDSPDRNVCTRGKRAKLQSKRKKSVELAEDSHSFSSHPESLELGKTGDEDVGSSFLDGDSGVLSLPKRRKRSHKSSGEGHNVSVPCQLDGPQISTSRHISSDQILGERDGEDITLACFLRNKSRKRRHKVAKNTNLDCSPSDLKIGAESAPRELDELHEGNQLLSTEDGEPQTCHNVEDPDNLLPCNLHSGRLEDMPNITDSGSAPGRQDPVQGKNADLQGLSINPDSDPGDGGDITLACFLQKKLKRR